MFSIKQLLCSHFLELLLHMNIIKKVHAVPVLSWFCNFHMACITCSWDMLTLHKIFYFKKFKLTSKLLTLQLFRMTYADYKDFVLANSRRLCFYSLESHKSKVCKINIMQNNEIFKKKTLLALHILFCELFLKLIHSCTLVESNPENPISFDIIASSLTSS